jgi:TetR/AcrR family transcriptional repressor for divergent bdcA
VSDVTVALGINPPSFYAAFRSKAGLPAHVLKQHNAMGPIPLAALLCDDRPVGVSLAAL